MLRSLTEFNASCNEEKESSVIEFPAKVLFEERNNPHFDLDQKLCDLLQPCASSPSGGVLMKPSGQGGGSGAPH